MSDKGQGWHGDSEGHAAAARGNSTEDSDSLLDKAKDLLGGDSEKSQDSDGQGWHGDSEGHAEAARGNNPSEDSSSNGSGEGQGWHGESERHSEAAKQD